MIYSKYQGKIKVIYTLHKMYNWDYNKSIDLNEEENYKQFIDKVNEFKEHPNLLAWYINDEIPYFFNKYLRNRTLSIHQIDPNHPSFTVIFTPGETNPLMNTTDIMGLDNYPIGRSQIRSVNYAMDNAYKEILQAKLFI